MHTELKIGAVISAVRITDNDDIHRDLEIVRFDPHHMKVGIAGLKGEFSVHYNLRGQWVFSRGNVQYTEVK